ncbi:MBL fold metallo-hydrolase RNA specificity domain-containing protein [Pseudidiomarina donghaiensis]|uniref:MBL fold metallo-hydrolase n=1 Tax=Pseudidiomarina donghaiensis TaxID=519452 RepID=A0A432XCM2_9GAMM|nr:MBL fold metallo-hydrolase [Pseudidiomarina donghaiensis]RUO46499.1 MBL fold metallo-hydrolase [Pseudidiomarina donghaiensis]SFV24678.1 metallo-beta-lactamase family protein [Pseudidiomarina donghaiensis]
MHLTFLGGCETVTGSKYLLETDTTRVLVDCGLFQGYKWLRRRNWQPLPMGIQNVDAIVLTHAHLDHSGFIPVLYKHGFRGPVFTHHATADLCGLLWPDSGRIQEEDAKFYQRHKLSRHQNPEPLYDEATADAALKMLQPVDFKTQFSVGDITFYLNPVGHILGAASVIAEHNGKRIGFSGDIGRPNDILMNPPEPMPAVDVLLLESTYGDRRHDPEDPWQQLTDVVNEAAANGGVLLIPSFAVGRAQVLEHMLATLMAERKIPRLPIFLDSPMAIKASDIYSRHHQFHRLSAAQCHAADQAVTETRSVEDSKSIAKQTGPHIIIAGSGMATGGRILHHFKHWLADHRATVLFSGHQAGGTRGAKMSQGVERIKVHGEWLQVKARIRHLDGLSGHADYSEIGDWLKSSQLPHDLQIHLVHGEPDALEAMSDYLKQSTSYDINIADYMGVLHL